MATISWGWCLMALIPGLGRQRQAVLLSENRVSQNHQERKEGRKEGRKEERKNPVFGGNDPTQMGVIWICSGRPLTGKGIPGS